LHARPVSFFSPPPLRTHTRLSRRFATRCNTQARRAFTVVITIITDNITVAIIVVTIVGDGARSMSHVAPLRLITIINDFITVAIIVGVGDGDGNGGSDGSDDARTVLHVAVA
jgi:hypothetical protein